MQHAPDKNLLPHLKRRWGKLGMPEVILLDIYIRLWLGLHGYAIKDY